MAELPRPPVRFGKYHWSWVRMWWFCLWRMGSMCTYWSDDGWVQLSAELPDGSRRVFYDQQPQERPDA